MGWICKNSEKVLYFLAYMWYNNKRESEVGVLTKTEYIEKMIENNNGYLFTKDISEYGISKSYLSEFVKKRGLERVAHGVYIDADTWYDELYILSLRNSKAVFSHETALYIHGLTEREPLETHVSVPYAYNAKHLRDKQICVHQVKDDLYEMGLTKAETNCGNRVAVYDLERTVCDMVKTRDKKDPQMFLYAIKEYSKLKNKNIVNLMRYAERMGVENEVRMYMEVLL